MLHGAVRRPENEWHNKEKLLYCETESVPAQTGLSVDSLLRSNKGNGNGGNSMTTSKADEKPTAFQEACVEDSEPKSDRKGKIAER